MCSPDRVTLYGLMVKPIQRFPQFILLLQVPPGALQPPACVVRAWWVGALICPLQSLHPLWTVGGASPPPAWPLLLHSWSGADQIGTVFPISPCGMLSGWWWVSPGFWKGMKACGTQDLWALGREEMLRE